MPHPAAKARVPAAWLIVGVVALFLLMLRPGIAQGQEGASRFVGELPPRGGVALVMWPGGTFDALTDAAADATSIWVTSDGTFIGFAPQAPDFVNARFRALFPGGQVPALPMIVVLPATAYASDEVETPGASVVPDWIDGLGAQTESRLREPYGYFATWPVIEGYALLGNEGRAIVEARRASFEREIGEPVPGSPIIQELNIGFEFVVASGSVIGVRFGQFEFFGAGVTNRTLTLWVDTILEQRLPSTALLDGDDALAQVVTIVREALRRDRPDLTLTDLLERGTSATDANYDSITFTPNGNLLIEFDEYQVGPGAAGSPRVVIPASIAKPLLSEFGQRARREVVASSRELLLPSSPPAPAPSPEPEASLPPRQVDCAVTACVALTFDDGPARPTQRLLDILEARGSRATFFVIGVNVPYNRDLLARMVAEGHELGNHTFDHRDLTKLAGDELRAQVNEASDAIEAASGQRPRFLRPPYGAVDDAMAAAVGMPLVLWSVDPRDWADHDATLVAQRVAADARRGSIILLHDIHETTVEAIPVILDDLARRGLTAVTVSELLGTDLVPGRIYREQ